MDFTAIDFETANNDRSSACAVGIAVVNSGTVVDTYSTLIHPPTLEFLDLHVSLHGITPKRVRKAPNFSEVWPEIQSRCNNGLVVAHNAPFDLSVMRSCVDHYDLDPLSGQCLCTVALARAVLPGLPNHKLTTLAALFGLTLDHHDAQSDAIACAESAIRLMNLATAEGVEGCCCDLEYYCSRGEPDSDYNAFDSESSPKYTSSAQVRIGGDAPLVESSPPDGRFRGKIFAFTGDFVFLKRADAQQIVEAQGGTVKNSVSKKTDFLVVSDEVLDRYTESEQTTGKLAKAFDIRNRGGSIQIIRASEFRKLI